MMLGLERADRTRIFSEELVDERGVHTLHSAVRTRRAPTGAHLGPPLPPSSDHRSLPAVQPPAAQSS